MTGYVALLRAVNVGGTGKLPMARLVEMCSEAGFRDVRTYIASGNAVFRSQLAEHEVRASLDARLQAFAGKPVGVLVRSAAEMADAVAGNPFPEAPGSRVAVLFTDDRLPSDPLDKASGRKDEVVRLGMRALFILYPDGQAATRLRLPAMAAGTARNMNTVAKLAAMAAELA